MIGAWIRGSVVSFAFMAIASCARSTIEPSENPSLDLTGTWSGVVGAGSGGGSALRVTWTANQSGSSASGPATLLTSPAVTNITFSGTLSGSLTGSRLSLNYVGLPGDVPGFANCSASGRGSAVASGSSTISGTLDVSFESCDGLGLRPPTNDQLTMTKQ
jgi:hypothetical protein